MKIVTALQDFHQELAPIISKRNTLESHPGKYMYCSTCKRTQLESSFSKGRLTCSNCLYKARRRASRGRIVQRQVEAQPRKDTKYCSSCKGHLAHFNFSMQRKTCRTCLFLRRLRRNAHICSVVSCSEPVELSSFTVFDLSPKTS